MLCRLRVLGLSKTSSKVFPVIFDNCIKIDELLHNMAFFSKAMSEVPAISVQALTLNDDFEIIFLIIQYFPGSSHAMILKNLLKSCVFAALCFFIYPFNLSGEQLQVRPGFPPLIESIRLKHNIVFCSSEFDLHKQDIKERFEKELLLALWNRPQVILWIKRSAKYFLHIQKILKDNGLPSDLKYVPLIESGLRPHVSSHRGAVGFWQFMRATGKRYGLRIDHFVDERRNIFKSTSAACRYIKDLKDEFGSYLLALSAYNMGESALKRAIKAQETSDFFSLYLPLQTQRYIFKILCAKLILENQAGYGFYLKKSDLYPVFAFDRIKLGSSNGMIPINLVAKAALIPFKTLKDYNPELRGYYLGKGNISILIPKGKIKGFSTRFTRYYAEWAENHKPSRFHIVKPGESLTGIAKRYRIRLSSLLKLNHISANRIIHPGDRLVIE